MSVNNKKSSIFSYVFAGLQCVCLFGIAELAGMIKFGSSILYNSLYTGCIVVGIAAVMFLIRNCLLHKSKWGTLMLLNSIVVVTGYWVITSMFSPTINLYLEQVLKLGPSIISFRSIFTLGLSIFQFVVGYFLSRFKGNLLGIFSILNGIIVLLLLMLPNSFLGLKFSIHLMLLLRLLSGITCSAVVIGISYYAKKFNGIPEKFGVIFNSAPLTAFILSYIFNNQFQVSAGTMLSTSSFIVMNVLVSLMFIIPGIIFLLDNYIIKVDSSSQVPSLESYVDSVKILIFNPRYKLMFIHSILLIIGMLTLRNQFNDQIFDTAIKSEHAKNVLKNFLEKGIIAGCAFMTFLFPVVKYRISLLIMTVMCGISMSVIFFHVFIQSLSIIYLNISFFMLGFSYLGHSIIQCVIGEEEKDSDRANIMITVANTSVGLISGAFIAQELLARLCMNYVIIILFVNAFITLLMNLYMNYRFSLESNK